VASVRFEVLRTVKMSMLFFLVVTPCGLLDTNVSEKHTVSIFRAEDLPGIPLSNMRDGHDTRKNPKWIRYITSYLQWLHELFGSLTLATRPSEKPTV
jgi:hypothetical protein